MARFIGDTHPAVASDLRSAVELGLSPDAGQSPALVDALTETVAQRCGDLDLASIVSTRRLLRASLLLTGTVGAILLLALLSPNVVRRGFTFLLREPTLFEGASVSLEPLVGDVTITYHYPAYTGLPPRTVADSSGEVLALKGTRVDLTMRALRSARRALLLWGDKGDEAQVTAQIKGDQLQATFVVKESGRYRVWLSPLIGRPVREDRGHRIEAAVDQPPVVEIRAAADRLELAAPRPIEIAYEAADDYGLGGVQLAFRVGEGAEKRVPLVQGRGKRQVRGETVWDPSDEALVPGVQIAYWIEARDLDTVSGGKVGTSRTLYLVLERPRESFDESIEDQHDIMEQLLGVLADRLELRHLSGSQTQEPDKAPLHAGALATIHDAEEAQVARLGHLIVEQQRTGGADKTLLASLSGIADRLTGELRSEASELQKLRTAVPPQLGGAARAVTWARLHKLQGDQNKHIVTLEDSVLLLDDLIGRQRLEDLAGLSRQLNDAFERLQDLLARYNATKDEELREQLLREIKEMRRRIAELAQKVSAVKQRNEIATEWQNMPDLQEAMRDAANLQDLLEKGDSASLEQALAELGESLKSLGQMLEGNANEFADNRFPKESRALNDLTRKISDIEGDERQLAGETGALAEEVEKAMDAQRREALEKNMKDLESRLAELNQQMEGTTPNRAGALASEDHARAQEHGSRAQRLMADRDLGEVRSELTEASKNLQHLGRMTRNRAGQDGPASDVGKFASRMEAAKKNADAIVSDLEQMAQQMQSSASAAQQQQAGQQAGRQGSIGQRTQDLAQHAQREGEGLPGFGKAQEQLQQAAREMGEAGESLQRGDARGALGRERAAIDRLGKLRQSLASERMGRSSEHREPVRIPGADDSQAPRAWRQELMEAMREKGPEGFREEVRRYYEELVK